MIRAYVRVMMLAPLLAGCALRAVAQIPPGPASETLMTTSFVTPLTYAAAMAQLDTYYDEQVGHRGPVAFPEIGPKKHFEVWHEMWADFEPSGDHTQVTLKCPVNAGSTRVVKSWMLDIAGRLSVDSPMVFKEEPGLRTVQSEIFTSRKDLARTLAARPAIRPLVSWRHSALFASGAPLTRITLSAGGLHGARQLAVTTVDLAAAKSLMTQLQRGAGAAGICGAFSEDVELETLIRDSAQNRNDALNGAGGVPTLYHPQMDLKYVEDKLRNDPAMQKRLAASHGYYDIDYRVDRPYRKVTVTWAALNGYVPETGKFDAAADVGQTSIPNVHKLAQSTAAGTARVHLTPLKTGAFRVRLTGEDIAGETVQIDERIFWFDGKTFEEPQFAAQ